MTKTVPVISILLFVFLISCSKKKPEETNLFAVGKNNLGDFIGKSKKEESVPNIFKGVNDNDTVVASVQFLLDHQKDETEKKEVHQNETKKDIKELDKDLFILPEDSPKKEEKRKKPQSFRDKGKKAVKPENTKTPGEKHKSNPESQSGTGFTRPNTLTVNYSNSDDQQNEQPRGQSTSSRFFKVSIQHDQQVYYSERSYIGFLTSEPIEYENFIIPAKKILSGRSSYSNGRLIISFDGVYIDGQIKDISRLEVYEIDGSRGIRVETHNLKTKRKTIKTSGKIASSLLQDLTGGSKTAKTLSNDSKDYTEEELSGSETLLSGKPLLVKCR